MLRDGEILIGGHNWHKYASDHPPGQSKGLIPRNYMTHPRGVHPNVKAVDFPTIPRSEWSNRLADKVGRKGLLSDILIDRNVPCLDQNGRGYCTTAETEVLTEKGWVQWPNYNGRDMLGTINPISGNLEFQLPLARQCFEYDGPIIGSTNRRIDFAVTPNHRMLVRKWDQQKRTLADDFTFTEAKDIGWYVGLPHAPKGHVGIDIKQASISGDREYKGDDFVALLGLITSDGYAGGSEKTDTWVSFACFREDMKPKVKELAERNGFHEVPSRPGVWIRYDAKVFADWLRANAYTGGGTGAINKRVPDIIKTLSTRQINLFLQWFDDRDRDGSRFYSVSKRMVDDLQELHMRVGKRSHIRKTKAKEVPFANKIIRSKEAYVLTVGETDRLCLSRKKHLDTDHYKGLVYCATVPNSTLITRLNGSVLISGNCWMHSGVGCVQAVRAIMGQPTIGLSAYSGACKIKNFRDEGGWGAQGADFLAQYGVCDEAHWPQQGTSRSLDNPANWENAKKYRLTCQLADMQAAQYDRNMTFEQYVTLWLLGFPTIDDHNWWGHSIFGCDLVEGVSVRHLCRNEDSGKLMDLAEFDLCWSMDDPVTAGFGGRIRNSWGSSWGTNGFGVLAGSKAVPDGGVGVLGVLAT